MLSFTQTQLKETTEIALKAARDLGAAQTAVEVSESHGLSLGVRKGELDTVEHHRGKSLGINILLGQAGQFSRGASETSDFSESAIIATVRAAYDIARYTEPDDATGLADPSLLYKDNGQLDLYHPWDLTTQAAQTMALEMEAACFAADKKIQNTDGCSVSCSHGQFYLATQYGNDAGFGNGYAYSRHSLGVAPIAHLRSEMRNDHWYSSERRAADLSSPQAIGRYAALRAASRLGARKIKTGKYPVLFEAPLAAGLLGSLVQAASGGALYRDASFLKGALGKRIFPKTISISENPFTVGGVGSALYDDEGVATNARSVVDNGVLQGYFLSSYTARKLNMQTTGNAGGSHNLRLAHAQTKAVDDLTAMLKKLGTGLFITDVMGQGVNYVNGDYSRGATGFWVQNGVIVHPVEEITIASNLSAMFMNIAAVGADEIVRGTKTTGSVLISEMMVAASK